MAFEILPQHVALIMDGNRRWARKNGIPQLEGHRRGYGQSKVVIEECLALGIKHVTFWAFSTENWKRERKEVDYLMRLLEEKLAEEIDEFNRKGIRFVHLGRKDRVPKSVRELLEKAEEVTKGNQTLTVCMAIDYGGRDEILRALEKACAEGKTTWTEADFSLLLDTVGVPDPDFIIRTSGEQRLSGFLLWQCAYSEFLFTDTCFPDFGVEAFHEALEEFQSRQRRFGS